jgi:hypothetical protein
MSQPEDVDIDRHQRHHQDDQNPRATATFASTMHVDR